MEKILYEVEKNTDKNGGKYFKSKKKALEYYAEQINFNINEKENPTCNDYEIFNYIQLVEHTNENTILLQQIF